MITLKLITIGKIKEPYLIEGIQEYCKRISKYASITIIELPDEPIPEHPSAKQIEAIQQKEAEKIQKQIKSSDFVCTLDLTGKQLSSEELADTIQQITVNGSSTIAFVIGGTTGLSREFVANSPMVLSFSKLTFPHTLIRLFLLEQLFRCFKILYHEKYHW